MLPLPGSRYASVELIIEDLLWHKLGMTSENAMRAPKL
jgi:hypothetical protein